MRASMCSILFLLAAAACAVPPPAPRAPIVPPLAIDAPVVDYGERARASADRSPPMEMTPDFADEPVRQPVFRTVVHTVEVEVPAAAELSPREEEDVYYDDYLSSRGDRGYRDYRDNRRYPRSNPFPINTAIGAGIGAIIGHQRGNRGRGALIGSGFGLLFDLHRWLR